MRFVRSVRSKPVVPSWFPHGSWTRCSEARCICAMPHRIIPICAMPTMKAWTNQPANLERSKLDHLQLLEVRLAAMPMNQRIAISPGLPASACGHAQSRRKTGGHQPHRNVRIDPGPAVVRAIAVRRFLAQPAKVHNTVHAGRNVILRRRLFQRTGAERFQLVAALASPTSRSIPESTTGYRRSESQPPDFFDSPISGRRRGRPRRLPGRPRRPGAKGSHGSPGRACGSRCRAR